MNLQALYDLKERLEYSAIAGIGMLQEDFRLKRAVEALAPLAAASAVFAKISTSMQALLAAPPQERSTRLLDVLSLVDAVAYTQAVTDVPGNMTTIEPGSGSYVQASYGQLQPLITAFSNTGSGRISLIQSHWEEHPEIFGDFRVLPHVVNALGENYSELAELATTILACQSSGVVPLLKDGFDPSGKRAMVRRVQLIAQLAGAQENDWLLSQLPESKKDVREAVIWALGECQTNAQLLLDLCHSERGKAKDAAMRSLSRMETVACADYWHKEIQKRPDSIGCLEGVNSTLAADMVAHVLRPMLASIAQGIDYDQSQLVTLSMYLDATYGKFSKEMCETWQWIADEMPGFAKIFPNGNVRESTLSLAEHLQKCMLETVLWNPCTEILALTRNLAERCGEWFMSCAFLADLIECSPAELFDIYSPRIALKRMSEETSAAHCDCIQIMRALAFVSWNERLHRYCLNLRKQNPITNAFVLTTIPLNGIDLRWVELLVMVAPDVSQVHLLDSILINLIRPEDITLCTIIGKYLHERILATARIDEYLPALVRCGWTEWKGLLSYCVKRSRHVNFYLIYPMLEQMPISNAEKAAELREIEPLIHKGPHNRRAKNQFQTLIAQLESDPDAKIF